MSYEKIKTLFNNEWIIKMCDDLISPTPFILKNKIRVLRSLETAISNSVDMSIPSHSQYKAALDYVRNMIDFELEQLEVLEQYLFEQGGI